MRLLCRFVLAGLATAPALAWAAGSFADLALGGANATLQGTHLIEIRQGSDLSRKASNLQSGGYESAQGDWIGVQRWYQTKWTDSRITWMTVLSPNSGVVWGLGTGERAEKYTIAPSIKLGFVLTQAPSKNSQLSLKASVIMGGNLRERSCTADYGDIGGVQAVNCRLAASTLVPAETLRYLLNEPARDRRSVMLEYKLFF
jgi:hypothetical protein